MESMRTLNTSLPRSPRGKRSNPPPEQLIQTFKAAALSVTNLYKTAAADQARAREAGYQDALDDILSFLDKENLGLGDGEGWRVRQWATERLDGSPLSHGGNDSDEDHGGTIKRARSSSPVAQPTAAQETEPSRQTPRSTSLPRAETAPVAAHPTRDGDNNQHPPGNVFTFTSAHSYPQDIDMQPPDNSSNHTLQPESHNQGQTSPPNPAVRVEVVPRNSRAPHRGSRHNARSGAVSRSLGTGAGSKRNFCFGDYEFDFGSPGEGRDSSGGGGKRGRHI